jgi:hypothetical protein
MVLTQSKFLLVVAAALYTSVGAFSPSSYSPASVSFYRHSSDCSLTCEVSFFRTAGRILMGYEKRALATSDGGIKRGEYEIRM